MTSTANAGAPAETWLLDAIGKRTAEFATQLRSLPSRVSAITPVPNLEWSIADLAQHIACLPHFWGGLIAEGDRFEVPSDFVAFSAQARAHITETDPHSLADLIESEFGAFNQNLADPTVAPRVLYGQPLTAQQLGGLAVSELVIHGQDLAAVSSARAPTFMRNEANAAIAGLMAVTPAFIDPAKAAKQPDGVYHLKFEGGREYTWTKSGPTLTVEEGRPPKADAHMSADPAMFISSVQGRVSQLRVALSGKVLTYGRRPWRFIGLGNIAVDGV